MEKTKTFFFSIAFLIIGIIGWGNVVTAWAEFDNFPYWEARMELISPAGVHEIVELTGKAVQNVFIGSEGIADDSDSNLLDEVMTSLVSMELAGMTLSHKPVLVRLNTISPPVGTIEEHINATPGILDLPPFTDVGSADSFFDVFFEIEIDGQKFYTFGQHLQAVLSHTPPGPDDTYENDSCSSSEPSPLLDETGGLSGWQLGCFEHRPNPEMEVDIFPSSIIEFDLNIPIVGPVPITMNGHMTHIVSIGPDGKADDSDSNGADEVNARLQDMIFETVHPKFGIIQILLDPFRTSSGRIEENVNNTPGLLDIPPFAPQGSADSFFDIFFKLSISGFGETLFTSDPVRFSSTIDHKPPGCRTVYDGCISSDIELVDIYGNPSDFSVGCIKIRLSGGTECGGDLDCDGDVDGSDAAILGYNPHRFSIEELAGNFGQTDCLSGMTSHEKMVSDYGVSMFEKIRDTVDSGDETKAEVKFVGNHIEVSSENWSYFLDINGHQIFRPRATYPHLRSVISEGADITRILDQWMATPIPQTAVENAIQVAMETLGVNYMGSTVAEVVPARELIATKDLGSNITKHLEGRTIILFSRMSDDMPMEHSYETSIKYGIDGSQFVNVEDADLPEKSFETGISLIDGKVLRIESDAPLTPEGFEITRVLKEGLLKGFIQIQEYEFPDLNFSAFFAPDEWRLEHTAYSFEGEEFITPGISFILPSGIPYCVDDPSLIFDYFIDTNTYKNSFRYRSSQQGGYNGIRGRCLDYNPASGLCASWEVPNVSVINHKDLGDYAFSCPPEFSNCFHKWDWIEHCNEEEYLYLVGGGYKLEQEFYDDLEDSHVAMISAHGGVAFCWKGFDFYQFMKRRDTWVSLHREDDAGLGSGNLRHLILASCSSMNWNHGPLHGEPLNLFSDWMNEHVANGIRTVCGADAASAGAHITGLRFFKYYHKGDSISQAWFSTELEKCTCNIPVVIGYGGSPDEAASNLFDGRFSRQAAGKGYVIAAEIVTPHLAQHQACCLPTPDPYTNSKCIDLPDYECLARGGTPKGANTHCRDHCPHQELVTCP